MSINAIDAVWIAAAALVTKATSGNMKKINLQNICFEAKEILDLAKQITDDEIDIYTVLMSATAHTDNSQANYLVDVNGLRRVSFMGEFAGDKECPLMDIINESRKYPTIQKVASTTEMFEFINRAYTVRLREGFSTNKKKTVATEWLISGNPTKFDVVAAFKELKKIDWKQSTNVAVGDIVYIYVSQGYQSIKYKCKVNKVDITKPEIDDRKYDITGEFDGTYGRYMEIELIKELEGELYSKKSMETHGFISPQSPIRVTPKLKEYLDLVQNLQETQELDSDRHDGSYELVRETINSYANMGDLSKVDYKDLNLIYLMSVGTWKQKVPAKKRTIADSNLPQVEKDRLTVILDKIWAKAEKYEYQNEEQGRPSIGMFGTGFFTFLGKTDKVSPRNFIQMCVDIKDMIDEQEILDRCDKTLNASFHGMKAASASMILHCLKPTTFPIFNSNMGADNIYVYLGAEMKWKTEIYAYIKNVRIVKKLRDENFTIKNYRLFDMAAWNIGTSKKHTNIDYLGVLDYLENNMELPYANPDAPGIDEKEKARLLGIKSKCQGAVAEMKKMAKLCKEKFNLDKCEPISWLDGSNTKIKNYLWVQLKYSEYGNRQESISLLVDMSETTNKARYRFSLELKNDGSDEAMLENYHRHLDLPLDPESTLVYMTGNSEYGQPVLIEEDKETIKSKIANGTYKKVQLCRTVEWYEGLTNDEIEQAMIEGITELIPFYEYVIGIENKKNKSNEGGDYEMNGTEFDKNLILYGPPGTGKTYNTAIYAVAICDGKSLNEVEDMPYEQVLERYNELKNKEKRIAFTTFHQSYGYEEFIEGIKPKMDSDSKDIEYEIKDGVFKAFCNRAVKKRAETSEVKIRDGARVWNVILGGSERPDLKQKCFNEGTIRIGWDEYPEEITEETENLNDKERRILLNFQDEIEIGDIVVARSTASTVDGVGIITSSAKFDTTIKKYPRKRMVYWICKGKEIEIIDLNGGIKLDRKSIYELTRVNISDLLNRIPENSDIEFKDDTRPYVFIIDEINRGNISKIFGELITLIEPTKRKGAPEAMEAILPYSNNQFGVPNNVYIIGTMNTADRSIALMDTALRRRFQFVEMLPNPDVLRKIGADKINEAGIELDVAYMLEIINNRIEYLFDREHTIGHAFFTGLKKENTVTKLADIFKKSVIPLLQEYFYEDYSKIMLVLGDNGKKYDENKFILATETKVNSIFRGDTSDIDIPEYTYQIQESAFEDIMSYIEITD